MLKKYLQKKHFLVLLFLILPTFTALFKGNYFPMHDDIQGMRVLQMQKCFLDFQIPCRWVPDMGYGYGYPQFNYYAPLPYYVMATPTLFGMSILASVKLGFLISILGAFFGMYLLGSRLWGKTGGVISALFYAYAPYRAVDIYVRGAMGEAWAFIFLPFILLYTIDVLNKKNRILPLALSFAGLFLSHNVTVLMFAPFYAFFVLLSQRLDVKNMTRIFLAFVWGVGISAFFTLPAFLEKEYVHVGTILEGYFNYLAHYVGIKQLLLSTFWGYGVSRLGDLDGMALSVGILHWMIPLVSLALLFYLKKTSDLKKAAIYFSLAVLALFPIHPRSRIIWDSIEIISYVQFPWRFLALAVLFFSLAAGSLGKIINVNKTYFVGGIFVVLILLYGSVFKPSKYLDINDSEKFSGESWKQQQTISIFDYLPKSASAPPASVAPEHPYSSEGEIKILSFEKGTNWQRWNILLDQRQKVVFPVYDFPDWGATINGQNREVYSDNDLGLITLYLEEGESEVYLRLENTLLRSISNIISFGSILFVFIYLIKFSNKEK